jgi:hypothetical protein
MNSIGLEGTSCDLILCQIFIKFMIINDKIYLLFFEI